MLRRSAGAEEAAARRATETALRCRNIVSFSIRRSGEVCRGVVFVLFEVVTTRQFGWAQIVV
jgi:hypothetical protein